MVYGMWLYLLLGGSYKLHGFWNHLRLGPLNRNCLSLCVCGLWGPEYRICQQCQGSTAVPGTRGNASRTGMVVLVGADRIYGTLTSQSKHGNLALPSLWLSLRLCHYDHDCGPLWGL